MSTEAQTNGLPARVRLTLSRADVSAREAVAIIADHAGNTIDLKKALSVTIAGAADVNGRLNIANGAWDVRFLASQPGQYICARLFSGGNLSYTAESMYSPPPPPFALHGEWIDSSLAADNIMKQPLPTMMGECSVLFLDLRFVADVGMFWEVRRSFSEAASSLRVTQSFLINASNNDVAAETVSITRAGVLVESRYRNRLDDSEWIDKLAR